jgi:hypothetical protein
VAEERHCKYYAENIIRWECELKGPGQHLVTLEIASELENLRLAIDWMVDNVQIEWLAHVIYTLGIFYMMLNRYHEGAIFFQALAENAKVYQSDEGIQYIAQLLAWQSFLVEQSGNVKLARQIIA